MTNTVEQFEPLRKKQVCAELGISARTLDNLVKSEQFPPGVRLGKWCYWSQKVLADWKRRRFAAQESWLPV